MLLASCKKDKLKDEKEILVGKWEWEYSINHKNVCSNGPFWTDTLTPQSEGAHYIIEFLKKGKVIFYKEGEEQDKKRIVFYFFNEDNCSLSGYKSFGILLNNDDDEQLIGCYSNNDTLIIHQGYPYKDEDCKKFTNYFVKIK